MLLEQNLDYININNTSNNDILNFILCYPVSNNELFNQRLQELKNLGVVNDVFKTNELDSTLQKYIDKITTSTPESVEVLMKNIDKIRSLNIQDSFLLEEEMGKELF